MNAEKALPPVEQVALYARAIMSLIGTDPEFGALTAASLTYDEDWTCFT